MTLVDPDQLYLSLRSSPEAPPLRRESDELCFNWTLRIAVILRHSPEYNALSSKVGTDCADLFIEKELFTELLPLARALVRRTYLKNLDRDGWRKPVRTMHRALIGLLREIWPDPEIKLEAANFVEYRLRAFAKTLRNRWYGWNLHFPSSQKIRLGIEMIEGVAEKGHRGELIWWDNGSPAADELFCLYTFPWVFNGQRRQIEVLKNQGIMFAAQYKPVAEKIGATYCPIPNGGGYGISAELSDRAAWLRNRISSWLYAVDWWERLFRKVKIKAWISVDESGVQSIAARAAMDRIGGITLFRQRSEYLGYPDSAGLMPSHIAFVWNKNSAEYLKLCRNRNEKIIIIGHTMGASPNSTPSAHCEIREEMEKNGARFVIAFLDAYFTRDQNMNPDDVKKIYSWLLDWLLENPDGGLVVKPKKTWIHTKQYVNARKLEKAQATGRLRFLFDQPHLLPLTVSRAADISIGLGLSSAALEANIAGLRAIHYHSGGSGSHTLEREAVDRIVIRSLENVKHAVRLVYSGQGSQLGLIGDLLPEVDEFGDGLGPARMHQVVELIMDSDLSDRSKFYEKLNHLVSSWKSDANDTGTSKNMTITGTSLGR